MNNRHRPFLVVVSSPSGAGKTSVCRAVVRQDKNIHYSVSATTRPPRPGEKNGKSYFFLSKAQFQKMLRSGALLESALVYGNYYGTPKKPLLAAWQKGKDVIADLDIQGMRSCRRLLPDRTVSVFLLPPSIEELTQRLKKRHTEGTRELLRRQGALTTELRALPEFDYVVINDKLEQAVRDLLAIIRAERLRTGRQIKKEVL